jgi:hypothetical protein
MAALSGSCLVILVAASSGPGFMPRLGPRKQPVIIVDDTGRRLPSLFAGTNPTAAAREALTINEKRRHHPSCAKAVAGPAWLPSGLWSLLSPRVVHAQDPCAGPCAGHWMTYRFYLCYPGCSSNYQYFYEDSYYATYEQGWQNLGTTCGSCKQCAEVRCTNGGPDPP